MRCFFYDKYTSLLFSIKPESQYFWFILCNGWNCSPSFGLCILIIGII